MLLKEKLGRLIFPHNDSLFLDRLHGLAAGALLLLLGKIMDDGNERQAVLRFFPGPPFSAMRSLDSIIRNRRLDPFPLGSGQNVRLT